MQKYTFMISGYENYDPSDYEYMYDEDRLWELTFDVIASSKEEAMKNLLNDHYTKERQIVDEKEDDAMTTTYKAKKYTIDGNSIFVN